MQRIGWSATDYPKFDKYLTKEFPLFPAKTFEKAIKKYSRLTLDEFSNCLLLGPTPGLGITSYEVQHAYAEAFQNGFNIDQHSVTKFQDGGLLTTKRSGTEVPVMEALLLGGVVIWSHMARETTLTSSQLWEKKAYPFFKAVYKEVPVFG